MSLVDPAQELETVIALLLVSGTDVADLVGARVWPAQVPPKVAYTNTQPALVVLTRGGDTSDENPNSVPSIQVRCFGGTPQLSDAYAVYYALRRRLRNVRNEHTATGRVLSVTQEMPGQGFLNTQTNWYEVLSAWRFNMKPA